MPHTYQYPKVTPLAAAPKAGTTPPAGAKAPGPAKS